MNFNQNNNNGDNIMFFGPQPRRLDGYLKNVLDNSITYGSKVTISSIMGDSEAFDFASQVKEYYR